MDTKTKLTIKELKRVGPGRWVRTRWDDCGAVDVLIMERLDEGRLTKNSDFRGFCPADGTLMRFDADQIIAVGNMVNCLNTGL